MFVVPTSFPTDLPAITSLFRAYALGFVEIGPYYKTPVENTVFMSLTF